MKLPFCIVQVIPVSYTDMDSQKMTETGRYKR